MTFNIQNEISSERKFDFLYKSVGGWVQFDTVIAFQGPKDSEATQFLMINPVKRDQWLKLDPLRSGTLVRVSLRSRSGKESISELHLALDRYRAIFNHVQSRVDLEKTYPTPAVQLKEISDPIVPRKSQKTITQSKQAESPVMAFNVTVNKVDTYVHIGNAHLIVTHVRSYPGKVVMYVLRGEKKKIQLDVDSIWSAEIRNGEVVTYEFFGLVPDGEFIKELAKKTNKYAQMDKVANE
jgi:hypothetical protein